MHLATMQGTLLLFGAWPAAPWVHRGRISRARGLVGFGLEPCRLHLQLLCRGPAGSLGPEAKRRLHWHDVWCFHGLYYSVGLGRLCPAASLEASLRSEGQRADLAYFSSLCWLAT